MTLLISKRRFSASLFPIQIQRPLIEHAKFWQSKKTGEIKSTKKSINSNIEKMKDLVNEFSLYIHFCFKFQGPNFLSIVDENNALVGVERTENSIKHYV